MSNYFLKFSTKFKKDFKKISSDKKLLEEVKDVFRILSEKGKDGIHIAMKPHKLRGNYKDHWECHVRPDTLLIWLQYDEPTKTINLVRIGSHSDLFNK